MDNILLQNSQQILTDCLGLKANESLLVVTDDEKYPLGEALYHAGKKIGAESLLVTMKERERSGQEPPDAIAAAMANADVVVCVTKFSLTHTQARKRAVAAGARLATMPGITEDMFREGAITANYPKVKKWTEKVSSYLTQAKEVKIEKDGHTLCFSVEGRNGISSTGMYLHAGESGNLPSGESYIAPMEGTASGKILIDGSVAGIGALSSPLLLTLEKGRIIQAEGKEASRLLEILGEGDGRLLAEFGIGTNDKARITGVILEDEKVYGTIHVAFGNNHTFGGTISAGVHIDGVVNKPTVYFDENLFIENGKCLILE